MQRQIEKIDSGQSRIYENFVPISLLAVLIPVAVMGISAYYGTQANNEKIEITRQDRQKFDIRLSNKMTVIDDKLDRVAILLERVATRLDGLENIVTEIKSEQTRRTNKVYANDK